MRPSDEVPSGTTAVQQETSGFPALHYRPDVAPRNEVQLAIK